MLSPLASRGVGLQRICSAFIDVWWLCRPEAAGCFTVTDNLLLKRNEEVVNPDNCSLPPMAGVPVRGGSSPAVFGDGSDSSGDSGARAMDEACAFARRARSATPVASHSLLDVDQVPLGFMRRFMRTVPLPRAIYRRSRHSQKCRLCPKRTSNSNSSPATGCTGPVLLRRILEHTERLS